MYLCATPLVCGYAASSSQLSPGTKRILADKQLLSVGSGSPHSPSDGSRFGQLIGASSSSPGTQQSPDGNDFLGRLEHQSRSVPGTTATGNERSTQYMLNRKHSSSSSRGNGRDGHLPEDCTFRPSITSKAAAKKGRSVEEMSEGDRLRKEVKLVSVDRLVFPPGLFVCWAGLCVCVCAYA